MPATIAERGRMPLLCPKCRKTLYSIARLRPEPRMDLTGGVLVLAGAIIGVVILLGSAIVLRQIFSTETPLARTNFVIIHYPPTLLVTLPVLPFAIIPGVLLGRIAMRRPKYRTLRCHSCGWSQKYPAEALWETEAAMPAARPTAAAAPVEFQIVADDVNPWKEAVAWAWAEVRQRRTPEDVERDLVAQGWSHEDAERIVNQSRG
jgi:hypothetical protein